MAEKNIAALLDKNACTIRVQYQHQDTDADAYVYVYVCNIPGVQAGDYVVVPTADRKLPRKHYATESVAEREVASRISDQLAADAARMFDGLRLTIAKVVQVDATVDLEPEDVVEYKWVISKVDLGPYTELMDRNKKVTDSVQVAYKNHLRRSFRERILLDLPEDSKNDVMALLGG